jgi:hypothetical protein
MRRTIMSGLVLIAVGLSLSACVVEGPPPGRACHWYPGHWDYGVWHPGHCA